MREASIDRDVIEDLREATGDEFLSELVMTFLDEAPTMIAELREAAEEGDADGFRRAAHSIKSNADTFGAVALAAQARAMELGGLPKEAATGGTLTQALDALDAEYARASAALKGILDG